MVARALCSPGRENLRNLEHLAQLISTYSEECSSLKQPGSEPAEPRQKEKWKCSPIGFVKVDCDGAFRCDDSSGGWGFVLHGDDGRVISSGYSKLTKILDPYRSKVIACL